MDPLLTRDFKKKIAMMKKAILKERQEYQADVAQVHKLQKNREIIAQILREKDIQIESYQAEHAALEAELTETRTTIEIAALTPLELMQQQHQALVHTHQSLTQEHNDLQRTYDTLAAQLATLQSTPINQDQSLDETLAEARRQQQSGEQELNAVQHSNIQLTTTNEHLKEKLASLKDSYAAAQAETERLHQAIQDKEDILQSLHNTMLRHAKNEACLSKTLLKYKLELEKSEAFYQRHEVFRLVNDARQPGVITLKRDNNGEYIVVVEDNQSRSIKSIRDVASVSAIHSSEECFVISFLDKTQVELQTRSDSEAFRKIKCFVSQTQNHLRAWT